jgi:hypothetical protein
MSDDMPPLHGRLNAAGSPAAGSPADSSSGSPSGSPEELLSGFLQGDQAGVAGEWRIEGALLLGRETSLAIRLSGAALVRHDLPPGAEADQLRQPLETALQKAGMRFIEERTVLGHVVGIEVSSLRGAEWDLWGVDPDTAHAALRARALGEVAERVDPEEPARRMQEAESLEELERRLWPES